MTRIIDFDDKNTFPETLCAWDEKFERMIRNRIQVSPTMQWYEIRNQLQDLWPMIRAEPLVMTFLRENMNTEVAICHCTRLLNPQSVLDNGLVTGGGCGAVGEKRMRGLLEGIGAPKEQVDAIVSKARYYWQRDTISRTESVHFFVDKSQAQKDIQISTFALNLGGEILRWAMRDVGDRLYLTMPYKRLWLEGTPSVVKFKSKLKNIVQSDREKLIATILEYFIIIRMFGQKYESEYELSVTGKTRGSVAPEDILSIEEIAGYREIQEIYEPEGFYDVL